MTMTCQVCLSCLIYTFLLGVDDLIATLGTHPLPLNIPHVGKWLGPHSFHVMVTFPGKEKEKEKGRGREGDSDLAQTQIKMKSRNEPHNEIVELELKGVGGLQTKTDHSAKSKIMKHSKFSSNSTTDPACLVSLPTGKKTLTVTAENLK